MFASYTICEGTNIEVKWNSLATVLLDVRARRVIENAGILGARVKLSPSINIEKQSICVEGISKKAMYFPSRLNLNLTWIFSEYYWK